MFDIGFIELFLVAAISLLVLGPERLPRVAVKAGRFIGQMKRLVGQWTDEMNRQIENQEMVNELNKQIQLDELNREFNELKVLKGSLSGETLGNKTADSGNNLPLSSNESASEITANEEAGENKLSASA